MSKMCKQASFGLLSIFIQKVNISTCWLHLVVLSIFVQINIHIEGKYFHLLALFGGSFSIHTEGRYFHLLALFGGSFDIYTNV